jgi:hypothetical protein
MKRREVVFRAPSKPLETKPLPEPERLRLYDDALKIQERQNAPPDADKARARKEKDELDDMVATFICELSERELLGSFDDINYGTYTWLDKNLTVKISRVSIKRKQIRGVSREWRIEFFS